MQDCVKDAAMAVVGPRAAAAARLCFSSLLILSLIFLVFPSPLVPKEVQKKKK